MRSALSKPRFFCSGLLEEGQELELESGDGHKVRNVLRCVEGDHIELRDSAAASFSAVILATRPQVVVRIEERHEYDQTAELDITLAQCLPKGSKMDYVVEKATELGVTQILPVQSERVIGSRDGSGKIERWRRLARAAAQQSGAIRVPHIRDVVDWGTLLEQSRAFDRVLIPWELAEAEPRNLDQLLTGVRSVLLVIGPEGGLSHHEIDLAREYGASPISLGRRILRTETAGLVAIAYARYAVGEV